MVQELVVKKSNFFGQEMKIYEEAYSNLNELLEKSVEAFSGKEMLVIGEKRVTYEEFYGMVLDMAANLQQKYDYKQGEKMATKKEHLDGLLGFKTNGEVTLLEVAKHLGLENQVIIEDQKLKLNDLEGINKPCGDKNPKEFISEIIAEKKENAKKVRNAALTEAFGTEVYETTKKSNKARKYAEKFLGAEELTEEKINEIKADEIFLALAAEHADVDSPENIIGQTDDKKVTNKVEEY